MNILAIGDIVGEGAVRKISEELGKIKEEENIAFTIVNAENSTGGMGLNEKNFNILINSGADVITMGDHTWAKKDIFQFIDHPKLIRPANYTRGIPGRGYGIYECNGKKIAVMQLLGRVFINVLSDNPFIIAKDIINEIKDEVDMIFLDFHAEATGEKLAMGRYLDGYITAMYGTHTHIPTADEQILPNGTGYITDVGMTGPKNSVIGMDVSVSIKRSETTLPERYKLAEGDCMLNGVIFEVDDNSNKVLSVRRIKR